MKFEEWKKLKESNPEGTYCDYVGCTEKPVWYYKKNDVYYCGEHRDDSLYREEPEKVG